jgi:hypothetical protein
VAKLHELLAVDANLKGQAVKCRTELQATMEKKRHLFQEKLVTFTPDGENKQPETKEQSDIQSTIRKEAVWIAKIIVKSIDASYSIDIANTQAKADIVLENGEVIAKDVPATALLQLEKRVKEVQEFLKAIPTLDPAKGFAPDPAREAGIFKARDVSKTRTEKIEEFVTIVPATKEHPAQVAKINKDIKVGTILEQEWSALITPSEKADLLERGEMLFRAVTQARSRANDQDIDVKSHKIGKTLLDYVLQPLLAETVG